MSASSYKFGKGEYGPPVCRNADGELDANGNLSFIGTVQVGGTTETRRFHGSKNEVIPRWTRWQRTEKSKKAKTVKQKAVVGNMAEPKQAAATPKSVYVLRFVDGRKSRDIAAYIDENKALDMAIDLKAALEIAEADGEYTVEQVALR